MSENRFVFYGRPVPHDWASVEHLLGKQQDAVIAEKLGCHKAQVGRMRKLLGIPRFNLADHLRPHLGTDTDRVVAERCGVRPGTVFKYRKLEGIPPVSRARLIKLQRARREAELEAETEVEEEDVL